MTWPCRPDCTPPGVPTPCDPGEPSLTVEIDSLNSHGRWKRCSASPARWRFIKTVAYAGVIDRGNWLRCVAKILRIQIVKACVDLLASLSLKDALPACAQSPPGSRPRRCAISSSRFSIEVLPLLRSRQS